MPKYCRSCDQTKSVAEFYLVNRVVKDKETGKPMKVKRRHSKCKECHRGMAKEHYDNNTQAYLDRNAIWRSDPKNRERQRRTHRRNTYKLTHAEFKRMLEAQGKACAICTLKFPKSSLAFVDHCHKSGYVRELLCNSCNVILGHSQDDVELLTSRGHVLHAAYVVKWNEIFRLRQAEIDAEENSTEGPGGEAVQ